ncbi:MAG: serine/threonine-protein kinase [Mycobacteriales bacterium]
MGRPEAGQRFAHFHVYSVLGRGGMGVVFSAYNVRDDRAVALKLLTVDLSKDPSSRERFQRESRLAQTLRSPYAVQVLDAGEYEGELWLEMPLMPGEDLQDRLAREGPLPPRIALGISRQVAAALDAAHALGLIHRDVKPANVRLIDASQPGVPHAFLGDFGLTRAFGSVDPSLTQANEMVGTAHYMAPEQVRRLELDPRVDVYSLACLLYATLTGAPPFAGRDGQAVMHAHLLERPPPLVGRGLPIGERLQWAVFWGLAKDPRQRPLTAGAFVEACIAGHEADPPTSSYRAGPAQR